MITMTMTNKQKNIYNWHIVYIMKVETFSDKFKSYRERQLSQDKNTSEWRLMSVSNYIRYHEAERLFKLYPILKTMQKNLQVNLENIEKNASIDDDIYSEAIGNRDGNSLPPTGSVSDKTGNLAIRYRRNLHLDAMKITQDIITLSAVIDQLAYTVTSMRDVQKLVLETYYWSEQNTWKQVMEVLNKAGHFMSKSKVVKLRNKGIEYIVTVSKITLEQYAAVMKITGSDESKGAD